MSDKKSAINEQIRRAGDLMAGRNGLPRRGAGKDARLHVRSTLETEFSLSKRQAGRRIRAAILDGLEYRVETRQDQITRTMRQLDRMIESEETPAATRLAAIKERISLLGLSPGSNGDPGTGAQQALYPVDPSVSSAQARDAAMKEKATDKSPDKTDEQATPLL